LKKFAVFGGLVAVALLLGVAGTAVRSDEAQAKPNDIIALNDDILSVLTGTSWDFTIPAVLAAWDVNVGNDDGKITPSDFEDVDLDANQLNEDWGDLMVLVFVSNDDALTIDADEGVWDSSGTSLTDCTIIGDEDCDADGDKGDGVVVDVLMGNGVADRGDAQAVATQSGVDIFLDYLVVGDPDDITLTVIGGDTIQEGMDASDCEALDWTDFLDEIEAPEVTGLAASVVDDDGTDLTGIWIYADSDDTDVVNVTLDPSVTVDLGDSGIAALNFACGNEVGVANVEVVDEWDNDADVDITVIGAPDAMTLTASPASIACDGMTSSTVSAALVDSEGNEVVDGTEVRFEVVALGISDPITDVTVDGAAKSTITPLSGVSAGVVVLVSVPSADLEGSIRVDCKPPAPPVAPPVVPPVVPPVTPPRTGDGGYLD
jgi:hypothetical protein